MERVVSRADLHSPARTPDLEPELLAVKDLKKINAFHYVANTDDTVQPGEPEDDLDFRLFAAASTTDAAKAPTKIRLRSPTPQTTAAGFVVPERGRGYYFADTLETEDEENFTRAALSGAQVQALSRAPWPGSAYEWKVVHLPAAKGWRPAELPASSGGVVVEIDGGLKRKRPGKKLRIRIRTKLAISRVEAEKLQAEAENSQAYAVAREAADREKRIRTNRAKKLRKRAKEKAGKTEVEANSAAEEDG
ncbi:hypothetical protein LTR35_016020 [Friedmanniomyces endolithicus]|uniref:Uncharacterized protein n=1 Tax=Friedmanniomyces endolithicus TaxID=329885 RepID=A0AAN6J1J4_9PEZI|nr:hypothetical protein LTS00_018186 [Friedmanniomyces endolithicus]KAK0267846.1 hypothetical protein LTR35_016020 [Friedmanniomyces endolithicus]KAK0308232.1 hypothetical protein LTR82_015566 [Friedmanniomyces endolithicus]KAK0976204.1 hypothetical protein LTR54_016623 [Friedmanniomyces endolithicus]